MKLVTFLKSFSSYNAGESAGFPDARADELIHLGLARLFAEEETPGAAPIATPLHVQGDLTVAHQETAHPAAQGSDDPDQQDEAEEGPEEESPRGPGGRYQPRRRGS